MRIALALLALSVVAAAQPPLVKDFRRIAELRAEAAREMARRRDEEAFAAKPREEKLLLAFAAGERMFDGRRITGAAVVQTCLMRWADVQRDVPTEAGRRVLDLLPDALGRHYAGGAQIPEDREDASEMLVKALDSDFLEVRAAAIECLKRIYRTAYFDPRLGKADRAESVEAWRKYVAKRNR